MREGAIAMLMGTCLSMLCAGPAGAALKVLDQPLWVFPGQTFRIAIEQPPGSGELRSHYPEGVELFDQWPKDAIQRFYFRALKPGDASLSFEGNGGSLELTVSIIPWSEAYQPREYEGIALPRVWPLGEAEFDHVKRERTLHTEEEIESLRASGKQPGGRAARWLEMPDEEVFDVVPGPCVPRTCLLVLGGAEEGRGKGCPVCGTKVYEGRSGFYPWLFDAEKHPWKVGCPSCGTWFPSNDFHKGDMHSGDFPDDGFGCEPVEPVLSAGGTAWRWPFVAYYHEWEAYMRTLTPGVTECAEASVTTGDRRYAHKAAIGLFRFAESMLDFSLNLNHRKMSVRDAILRWPVGAPDPNRTKRLGGSFLYIQPNWDTPRMEEMARAWDLVLDQIDGDDELLRFCREHYHPEIETTDDFRRFVEAGVHRVPAQAALDNAVSRNWPMQETMLATVALAMDTPRSLELVDWLLNEGAGIRYSLTNEYFKDGSGHESEGYNGIQIRDMSRLILLLDDIARRFPDEYQPPKFVSLAQDRKFRQIYLFPLWNSLIGRTYTCTGDTGGAGKPDLLPLQQGYPLNPSQFAEIYQLTKDPRFAQALYGPQGQAPGSLPADLRAEVERVGQELGWQVATQSDILDGYGHAILRSGEGDRQRALWARYGKVIQHTHPDMLTIGFEALQRKLLPEMGYPQGWTYARSWETNWGTHYVTHIGGHSTWNFRPGSATLFADSAPARIATARSEYAEGEPPRPYRERTIVLVDIDERDCYAVTLERVFGGGKHYWSFHGPDGEALADGVELTPQNGGTMLGPGMAYGDDSSVAQTDRDLSCFAFMQDVARGQVAGTWSLDYLCRDQDDVHLRMTAVHPRDGSLATAKGRAPGGKSNYEITWAIWEQEGGEPLASQFLTVLEPYEGARLVQRVDPVPVEGQLSADGFAPLAVRVTGDGFTDTLVFQPTPGLACSTEDGLTSDGEFGFWRERDGVPVDAVLAGGTRLGKGQGGIGLSVATYAGTIEECDWAHSTLRVKFGAPDDSPVEKQEATILIDAPEGEPRLADVRLVGLGPGEAGSLVGQHIRITNDLGNHASYLIKEAQWIGDAVELTVELDPRLGEGFVESCSDGALVSGVGLRLAPWGYYAGKTLANEDGSVRHKLRDVEKGKVCRIESDVPAAQLESEFADRDGDALRRYLIYDYGPGDTVTLKTWLAVRTRGL
jgi:hypothetical protein